MSSGSHYIQSALQAQFANDTFPENTPWKSRSRNRFIAVHNVVSKRYAILKAGTSFNRPLITRVEKDYHEKFRIDDLPIDLIACCTSQSSVSISPQTLDSLNRYLYFYNMLKPSFMHEVNEHVSSSLYNLIGTNAVPTNLQGILATSSQLETHFYQSNPLTYYIKRIVRSANPIFFLPNTLCLTYPTSSAHAGNIVWPLSPQLLLHLETIPKFLCPTQPYTIDIKPIEPEEASIWTSWALNPPAVTHIISHNPLPNYVLGSKEDMGFPKPEEVLDLYTPNVTVWTQLGPNCTETISILYDSPQDIHRRLPTKEPFYNVLKIVPHLDGTTTYTIGRVEDKAKLGQSIPINFPAPLKETVTHVKIVR